MVCISTLRSTREKTAVILDGRRNTLRKGISFWRTETHFGYLSELFSLDSIRMRGAREIPNLQIRRFPTV